MKSRKLIFESIKNHFEAVRIICFSILIIISLTSVSFANDKSVFEISNSQSSINKNSIKEIYYPDKSFEKLKTDLVDTNPQEIAKNIENISKKYNIDINNVSKTISGENADWPNENIVIRSPYEEKILLISFAGNITIKDTIDLYKLGFTPYSRISGNTIAKLKAENIEKLRSYPFINKIREYKTEDKITPYDKIKINEMKSNNKNISKQVESPIRIYHMASGKRK